MKVLFKYHSVAVCLAIVLVCFCGCKGQSAIVLPQTHDSVRVSIRTEYDSVFIDRYHIIKEKGDTIYIRDSIFIEKWRELNKRDTLFVEDSIPYPVEVVKEVRRRNGYDRFTSIGFWVMIVLLISVIALRIYLRFKGVK